MRPRCCSKPNRGAPARPFVCSHSTGVRLLQKKGGLPSEGYKEYAEYMDITIKRIYDDVSHDDGYRVLIDRLWPRGVAKDRAHLNEWAKDLAPSNEARIAFGHKPELFEAFRQRYRAELDVNPAAQKTMQDVLAQATGAHEQRVSLIYAAKDQRYNHAVVLRDYMVEHIPNLVAVES